MTVYKVPVTVKKIKTFLKNALVLAHPINQGENSLIL